MSAAEAIYHFKNFFRDTNSATVIMAGDTVSRLSDGATGIVEFIGDSPYYGESVERAYVLFYENGKLMSSDYLLAEEIELVK